MKTPKPKATVYPEIHDNAEMASRVEEGLPVRDLVAFGRHAGFTTDELARLIHIPPRTYARRVAAKARLKVPEGERAVRLMRLYDLAKRVFVTDENTRGWFHGKIRALGGKTPLEFARTEPGAREVENIIGRIEDGIFS
ncbi:MAG TPA: antitoxin Xre-like helix-turn-helix domain-containing protein [Opitutaceae bacterium]|nr:antitoxin Xre-like helix-turn-helix domain-containing protein [Opitutaceae bacterium]